MTKGPCHLESRPRGETLYAVVRSNENARSPLDFVSGYGPVSTPFRARPTRSACRRACVGTSVRGNETGYASTSARAELVGPSPHTTPAVERSILRCFPLAWENRKGGTPFARFFPLFLVPARNRAAGDISVGTGRPWREKRALQTPTCESLHQAKNPSLQGCSEGLSGFRTSFPLDHEFFHLNNFVWVIYHTVF